MDKISCAFDHIQIEILWDFLPVILVWAHWSVFHCGIISPYLQSFLFQGKWRIFRNELWFLFDKMTKSQKEMEDKLGLSLAKLRLSYAQLSWWFRDYSLIVNTVKQLARWFGPLIFHICSLNCNSNIKETRNQKEESINFKESFQFHRLV